MSLDEKALEAEIRKSINPESCVHRSARWMLNTIGSIQNRIKPESVISNDVKISTSGEDAETILQARFNNINDYAVAMYGRTPNQVIPGCGKVSFPKYYFLNRNNLDPVLKKLFNLYKTITEQAVDMGYNLLEAGFLEPLDIKVLNYKNINIKSLENKVGFDEELDDYIMISLENNNKLIDILSTFLIKNSHLIKVKPELVKNSMGRSSIELLVSDIINNGGNIKHHSIYNTLFKYYEEKKLTIPKPLPYKAPLMNLNKGKLTPNPDWTGVRKRTGRNINGGKKRKTNKRKKKKSQTKKNKRRVKKKSKSRKNRL